jgi:hypothetical protein
MQKILPLVSPPTETYQGISFILGVLLANENTKNVYYNNYINIQCIDTDNIEEVKLNFTNVLWENYRLSGIAEMNMYCLDNIHCDCFVNFIKERINQGNYLLFYNIDEYYLSYSNSFQNTHYCHDTYVYGYENSTFCVMAYKGRKLSKFNIPMSELQNGLYCHINAGNNLTFCTFRPTCGKIECIDMKRIRRALFDYYHSECSENADSSNIYGISIYDVLIKCIKKNILGKVANPYIDFRTFRLLWEHKKILKDHILKINELTDLKSKEDNMVMIGEIEAMAEMIFNLVIKYSLNDKINILEDVCVYLAQLRKKEKELINLLLAELKNE